MGIHSSDLFVKSREAGVVEARQLLFFLCHTKQKMGYSEIKKYTDRLHNIANKLSYYIEKGRGKFFFRKGKQGVNEILHRKKCCNSKRKTYLYIRRIWTEQERSS